MYVAAYLLSTVSTVDTHVTRRHKTRDAAPLSPPLLQGKGGLMSLINGGDMQLLCNVSSCRYIYGTSLTHTYKMYVGFLDSQKFIG